MQTKSLITGCILIRKKLKKNVNYKINVVTTIISIHR